MQLISLKPYRLRIFAGAGCLVVLAVTSASYAYLTGPLLQLILTGGTRGQKYLTAVVPWLDPTQQATESFSLLLVAALLVGLAFVKGLANLGQTYLFDGLAEQLGYGLRKRLYHRLLHVPLAVHRRYSIGDLTSRIVDDVRRTQESLVAARISIAREGLAAMALLTVAIGMAPWLALLAAIALPLVGLIIAGLGKVVKTAAIHGQHHLGRLAARAGQGMWAIREVKAANAEERELQAVCKHGQEVRYWTMRQLVLRALAPLFNETIAAAVLGGTLLCATGQVARGSLPPERLVSFFTAVLLMYKPIKEIGRAFHVITAGQASMERLDAVLQQETEADAPLESLPPLERKLELQEVEFSYDHQMQWSLPRISFSLEVGRMIALAGPSGAGKTTLVNLICGLERPQRGRMLWDGLDLGTCSLTAIRARVALVPQQPLLLEGSLAENLRYCAPDATAEDLRWAISAAGLGSVVEKLPHGLETDLGPPDGIALSVGEVQRLSLARALLRHSRLLVLDEPSAALDADNEAHLISVLQKLARTHAILVIAHSSALLQAADEIIHLEEIAPPPTSVKYIK